MIRSLTQMAIALLAAVMFVFSSPSILFADEAVSSKDFYYEVSADGTATITHYSGSAQVVVVPLNLDGYPVVAIGDESFRDSHDVTEVVISDGITEIKSSAFVYCAGLEKVSIPPSVKTIGYHAFGGCRSLKEVELSEGLLNIEERAFEGCGYLRTIYLPKSVISVGELAFADLANPSKIIVSTQEQYDLLSSNDAYLTPGTTAVVMAGSDITAPEPDFTYTLSDSGEATITGCSEDIFDLVIPSEIDGYPVVAIGDDAFSSRGDLTTVIVSEGITDIGDRAFYSCNFIEKISLPSTMALIGEDAFFGCASLKSVTIPGSVSSIGFGTFANCKSLETLVFSEGVSRIGQMSFFGCESLVDVTLPATITSLGIRAFSDCFALERIDIPEGVAEVGNYAFDRCTALTNVSLPSTLKSIGRYAFNDCSALVSLDIPRNVTVFGESAFTNLANSSTITVFTQAQYDLLNSNSTYISVDRTAVAFSNDVKSVPAPIAKSNLVYTGSEQIGVTEGEGYSLSGTVKATDAGSYFATATLLDGFVWTDGESEPVEIRWTIARAPYSMSGTSFDDVVVTYDGKPHSVFVSGDLPEGLSVSYEGNGRVDAGSYDVTATFTADANHEAPEPMTAKLTVEPAAISSADGLSIVAQPWTGAAVEPELILAFNGKTLSAGTDYSVAYESNIAVGRATAIVTGMGNFQGSVKVEFEIIQGEWVKSAKGWWYRNCDGTYPKGCWQVIDGKRYYFNASGYMQTGWLKSGSDWYYLASSGVMAEGWTKVGGKWYYLEPGAGALETGWFQVDDKWYYANASGAMQTGWLKSGSSWYYLKVSGAMASAEWLKSGGSWYWFAESGKMATGWQQIEGDYYYFSSSGVMQKSKWVGSYYLLSSGKMATNQWVGNYYVGDDGKWIKGYGLVYWVSGGEVYHSTEDCVSLARSTNIKSGTIDQAQSVGKTRVCKNCS